MKGVSNGILLKIKRAFPLLAICLTIIGCTYYMLDQHYKGYFFTQGSDLIYATESRLFDTKVRHRGPQIGSGKVGILAIDEKTIQEFGSYPFQRRYYYQAFKNLKDLGVAWIGFDVVFAEPQEATITDVHDQLRLIEKSAATVRSKGLTREQLTSIDRMRTLSPSDHLLSQGIREFENIVGGYFYFTSEREAKANLASSERFEDFEALKSSEVYGIFPVGKELSDYRTITRPAGIKSNIPIVSSSTEHFAFFSNDSDDDAINRWVTLVANVNNTLQPSLGLKLAAEFMNRDILVFFDDAGIEHISLIDRVEGVDEILVPVDPVGTGRLLVNHRGPGRSSFPHFSLADAYNNSFSDEQRQKLQGAVLLLGATATGTNDVRPNPFDPSIDGVENHAAVVDNLIMNDYYRRPFSMYKTERLLVIVFGLLFAPIMIWAKALISGLAVIGFLIGLYLFDQYYWFERGVWAYLAVPSVQIVFMFICTILYKYMTEEREKAKVKDAFQHYLSRDVIEQMLDNPESLKLGGERRVITVYFSDVRGFTKISEVLSPEALCEYMNQYFTPMTDAILQSGGTLDKYIGDAIMAFWGAPLELADHADRAAAVAIEHLVRLDSVRSALAQKGYPPPDMGIGLNTGPASVGNMGSNERFTYTAMGDSVNLGSRLEGLTKEYGIKVLISEYTYALLSKGRFFTRDLDDIRVVGKNKPVRVYELMRPDYLTNEQSLHDLIGEFARLREAYRQQDWLKAEQHGLKCLQIKPDDGPTNTYLQRMATFKSNAPDGDWDGVYTFIHK